MSYHQYRPTYSEPLTTVHQVRLLGQGAAAPTKELGKGLTVTYVAVGHYRLTWARGPGIFLGASRPGFIAATPGDVARHNAVLGDYDSANRRIDLYVTDSAGSAVDLAATQRVYVEVAFKQANA